MQYFKDVGPSGLTSSEYRNRTIDSLQLTTVTEESTVGVTNEAFNDLEADNIRLQKVLAQMKQIVNE